MSSHYYALQTNVIPLINANATTSVTENVTMYNDTSRRTSLGSNFAWSTGHRGATLRDAQIRIPNVISVNLIRLRLAISTKSIA